MPKRVPLNRFQMPLNTSVEVIDIEPAAVIATTIGSKVPKFEIDVKKVQAQDVRVQSTKITERSC
jgi:hypothetical protein